MTSHWTTHKALLEISAGCNTDCIFCRRNFIREKVDRRKPIDFERLKAFLDLTRKIGLRRVEIGGDEPTTLPLQTLASLSRFCLKSDFKQIALISNGVRLARKGWSRTLAEAGINIFILPLYGSTEEIHDAVTQRQGSFRAVCETVSRLKDLGVTVLLHTLILRSNEKDIASIMTLAQKWKLPLKKRSLNERDSHIDYLNLHPVKRSVTTGAALGAAVRIRYKLLAGEIDCETQNDTLQNFIHAKLLAAREKPRLIRGNALSGMPFNGGRFEKKSLRDPIEILSLIKFIESLTDAA